MPRDNEERGRRLAAFHLSRDGGKPDHFGKRSAARPGRLETYSSLLKMLALLWGAHWLARWTTRLFFRGILSPRQTLVLMRTASRLNRASLATLRQQRRRLSRYYAGNDNHDHRT